jgi:trk system potassium uptake protein TrkH
MNIILVSRIVCVTLLIVGTVMLTALPVGLMMGDSWTQVAGILWSALITVAAGAVGVFAGRGAGRDMALRDGFGAVTFSWVFVSLFGALPFVFGGIGFVDAVFEATSGFTTTGASVLVDVEALSYGLLYWRSMAQWLGGMGIIVLAIAVLPMLGIGGMQLYKTEAPGPTSERLTPRIATTAKMLWGVYVVLTLIATVLLMFGGMSLFDAWCHACCTMATGGFSTKSSSIAAFDSVWIEGVIIVFMFLAAANFVLHLRAVRGTPLAHWKDEEFRGFTKITVLAIGLSAICLIVSGTYEGVGTTLRHATFAVVSVVSTTGFSTEDFGAWPTGAALLLLIIMVVGGCGGSTSGGTKVSRLLLLIKAVEAQRLRSLLPNAVVNIRMNNRRVPGGVMAGVLGFFFAFVGLMFMIALAVAVLEPGIDGSGDGLATAVSASVATLCNIGPGLGAVGPTGNYAWMTASTKLVLSFAMIMGRLELFTVIVLFQPRFWRR